MIQEQTEVESSLVPYLSFDKETASSINENLITPRVKKFFQARQIDKYHPINAEKYISDLDFKTVDFKYLYENILVGIKKEAGKIVHEVKYCVTLDEETTKETCKQTNIKYSEILLNKKPIFYFIYFDFKEIMNFVRR
ncbi:MAG: hypothetical protein QM487_02190 [Candidatus Marithrix sp.]